MNLVAQLDLSEESPPGRVYLHEAGLSIYPAGSETLTAFRLFLQDLEKAKHRIDMNQSSHFLAISWGNTKNGMRDRIIDLYCFSGLENWKEEPKVQRVVLTNGLILDDHPIFGDTIFMLGEEGRYRSETDRETYLKMGPFVTSSLPKYFKNRL